MIKVWEFGSPQGEEKRPKDWWVSIEGLVPLMDRLGAQGWEAFGISGTDVMMKRQRED